RDAARPRTIVHPVPRTSMHQDLAAQVVDDAVDRLTVLQERERDGAVDQPQGVVVRPVDRIEDPAEAGGDRDRLRSLGQLLAEILVAWKLPAQLAEDVLRDR